MAGVPSSSDGSVMGGNNGPSSVVLCKLGGVADCALVDGGVAGSGSIGGTAVVKSIPYVAALHGKNGDGFPPNGSDLRDKLQGMHASDSNEHVADGGIALGEGTAGSRTPNNHAIGVINSGAHGSKNSDGLKQGKDAAGHNVISPPKTQCKPNSYAHAVGGEPSKPSDNFSIAELQYYKPNKEDGRVKVCPPHDVSVEGSNYWQSTLVGYFLDKKLPFPVVNSVANKIWGKLGLCEVLSYDKGVFLFKFDTIEHACMVLERGPWHIINKAFILKKWHPSFDISKEVVSKIPVWIKFFNVPLEFWTTKGLSFVASAVGIPLHADFVTFNRKRLNFARICVEIDARDQLIYDFDLKCSNGEWVRVSVEYEGLPSACSRCGIFGHATGSCLGSSVDGDKKTGVWVPVVNKEIRDVDEVQNQGVDSGEGSWAKVQKKKKKKLPAPSYEEGEVLGVGVSIDDVNSSLVGVDDSSRDVVDDPVVDMPIGTAAGVNEGDGNILALSSLEYVVGDDVSGSGDDLASPIMADCGLATKVVDSLEKMKKKSSGGRGKKGKKHASPRGGKWK